MITPLYTEHLSRVARLHLEHLRTPFRGYAGMQLLRCYYATMIKSGGACSYVAVDNGRVAGYVCGVWNPQALTAALLRRHLINVLFWGTLQVLRQPTMLTTLAGRLVQGSDHDDQLSHTGYELRPIVVAPDYRGTGIAQQLVQRLLRDAAERGFDRLFLYTEDDNAAANAFYSKLRFERVSTHHMGSTTYFRYEHSTSDQNA